MSNLVIVSVMLGKPFPTPGRSFAGGEVTCGETKGAGREGLTEPAANSRILTPWNCIFHSFILQMKEQWSREDEKQD